MFDSFLNLSEIDPDDNHFEIFDRNVSSPYLTISEYNSHEMHQNSSLIFYNFNIRSFNANSVSFLSTFESVSRLPQVLVLSETWFRDVGEDLEGYYGYHTIRNASNRAGGVSVYVKSNISSKILQNLSFCNTTIEICTVEIKQHGLNIFVLGIYRPHSDSIENFSDSLRDILENDTLRNKHLVILGDININLLNENSSTNYFINFMRSHYLIPIIQNPTRFQTSNQNGAPATLLDHIWTNKQPASYSCGIILCDISDHLPAFFSLPIDVRRKSTEKRKITFRLVNDESKMCFVEKVSNIDWSPIIDNNDVDFSMKYFISQLNSKYCESFAKKTKLSTKKRTFNPWMNENILKLINFKSEYYRLLRIGVVSNSENNLFKNKVNSIVKKAKKNYHKELFEKCRSNLRKTWSNINKIISPNSCKIEIDKINVNGTDITDKIEIANNFNNYFSNVASTLVNNIPHSTLDPISLIPFCTSSLVLNPVTYSECQTVIQNLKLTKTNEDELPVYLFKIISPIIVPVLTKLLNNCFTLGTFPKCLKKGTIIPIHKKGDFSKIENFRPITLLPYLSKILEKLLYTRLYDFLTCTNFFSKQQFGFLKNKSTADAILSFTEYQYEVLNEKEFSVNIFVDFAKAFDTVDHSILLRKLDKYGVRGIPHKLFKSYLSDRSQLVMINSHYSSESKIKIGIPQGSVMGCLLFLIYINDLPAYLNNCHTVLFADDTNLSFRGSSLPSTIAHSNAELQKFYDWTVSNKLTINYEKTFYMIISTRNVSYVGNVLINGKVIESTGTHRFLGVIIDKNLKFDAHISEISNKIAKSIGILYKLSNYLPFSTMKALYFSFIHSYLSYANVVWGGTYATHLLPLFRLQKKSIRIINKVGYRHSTQNLFLENRILKLEDIHTHILACYAFKNFSIFESDSIGRYLTRNSSNLIPAFQRLNICQHSIFFKCPHTWNTLPDDLKSITEYDLFNVQTKMNLIYSYSDQ